jgi:uncharacterized protein YkwD
MIRTSRPRDCRLGRAAAVLGVFTAFLLPLAATGTAEAAAATVNAVRLNGYEASLVADVNRARASHGLHGLVVVAGATDVARRWSWRLASAQALSHNPSLVANIQSAGSSAWTMIAENVGDASATNPGALFTAYMNSAPHRANILDPSARYLGIGVVQHGSLAWNTMDFTNAYSSTYGLTRVPADGMSLDSIAVTTTRSVASFESRYDERAGTNAVGGVSASLVRFTGPTTNDDRAYATFVRHSDTGHGDLIVRDAWSLSAARTVTVRAAVGDPAHHSVGVQVILGRSYGSAVSLGTMSVRGVATSATFSVPSSARGFMDTLTFRVQTGALGAAGGSAVLSIFNVTVGV